MSFFLEKKKRQGLTNMYKKNIFNDMSSKLADGRLFTTSVPFDLNNSTQISSFKPSPESDHMMNSANLGALVMEKNYSLFSIHLVLSLIHFKMVFQ